MMQPLADRSAEAEGAKSVRYEVCVIRGAGWHGFVHDNTSGPQSTLVHSS